jgi:hypothetical protein
LWRDQFDWVYREIDYAAFPVTLHPDVSGRPQVLLMLERLIGYWRGHDGVRFITMEEAADDFRRRFPFGDQLNVQEKQEKRWQRRTRASWHGKGSSTGWAGGTSCAPPPRWVPPA